MKLLLLDNFDSFTHILAHYLVLAGFRCEILRNDTPLSKLFAYDAQAIVLSPGPGRPHEAGVMMELLSKEIGKKPILGICLGHQAIGQHFGAVLDFAPVAMHGKVSLMRTFAHHNNPIFVGLPKTLDVARYHSLSLTHLPECLFATATSMLDNQIMGLCHAYLPVWGLQFHPEAVMTGFGQQMLDNWYRTCQRFYLMKGK